MKLSIISIVAIALLAISAAEGYRDNHYSTSNNRIVCQNPTTTLPNITCNDSTEGVVNYSPKSIWICKNSKWLLYKKSISTGLSSETSGHSCKQILDQFEDCTMSMKNGLYWVQGMQVYCEMCSCLNGGGWTLVWQHSYMEDLPLTTNMTFFSDYYKPCTQHATSWCNIPNKARFNPTEQMIVAYHHKRVIYSYKGVFNRNIDHDWSGGILMAQTMIIDQCRTSNGIHPNPVNGHVVGITFNKLHAYDYRVSNTDGRHSEGTIKGTLTKPIDHRWHYCDLPSFIANDPHSVQMTLAIYVR